MYGGVNYNNALGNNPGGIYFIEVDNIVSDTIRRVNHEEFTILTLEDYLKKYPCKVGEFVNVNLYNGEYFSDEIVKIIWGSKEEGPFYITKHGYARTIEDVEYIVPYDESNSSIVDNGQEVPPMMKLYKVTIKTFYFGIRMYELFVLADSEESMRSTVNKKIRRDDDAEILSFEEIDLKDTTNRVI
jgi:hypothetical protein